MDLGARRQQHPQRGFDTATLGMKSGTITVTSTSQAVQNGIGATISRSASWSCCRGDYNGNGIVDAADYGLWRNAQGQSVAAGTGADGSRNGTVDPEDYTVWRTHFGQSASGGGRWIRRRCAGAYCGWSLLLVGACLCGGRRTTLRAWTRKS